jgi:hypothetical protein
VSIDLGSYNTVAERIAEFRDRYPDGSLQPADPAKPFEVVTVGERLFLTYTAAAYRSPDDQRPGIGVAWEPFPGKTPYTKDSELQNVETSAWGRAIVAALAADTRKGITSAEEVRNRQADRDEAAQAPTPASVRSAIARAGASKGMKPDEIAADFTDWSKGVRIGVTEDVRLLSEYLEHMQQESP